MKRTEVQARTSDIRARIHALHARGFSQRSMAEKLGISRGTLIRHWRACGLAPVSEGRRKGDCAPVRFHIADLSAIGLAPKQIAGVVCREYTTVMHHLRALDGVPH